RMKIVRGAGASSSMCASSSTTYARLSKRFCGFQEAPLPLIGALGSFMGHRKPAYDPRQENLHYVDSTLPIVVIRRNSFDQIAVIATTISVMNPPKRTDGTVPISRAVTPDSNAPISFDEPMKI